MLSGRLINTFVAMFLLTTQVAFESTARSQEMNPSYDQNSGYVVLGIISSTDRRPGVALFKNKSSGKTIVKRIGDRLGNLTIYRITRKRVILRDQSQTVALRVGFDLPAQRRSHSSYTSNLSSSGSGELQRDGNMVYVSSTFKDHLIGPELNKVLMQMAAEPFYSGNRLSGFRLSDIQPGSVFEKAGLLDGDVVTAINGREITDVGSTIRHLNSLRNAEEAGLTLIRNGQEESLKIVVR